MELKPGPALPTRLVGVHPYAEGSSVSVPLFLSRVGAGFSSPADDHVDQALDLGKFLVQNPAATILGWAEGDSMIEYGIYHRDLIIIDCSLEPKDGDTVAVALDGEMLVKKLVVRGKNGGRRIWLVSGNDAYPPIEVQEGHELVIRGVVTHVVHSCR